MTSRPINEALDEGDPAKTLDMLLNPSAKLTDVDPSIAQHYHNKLGQGSTSVMEERSCGVFNLS
uniref:Pyruvate carboxyltransferase domain-containing protein n=1 Tax=Oryzias sinensis TaxID=183150 RepID=A0A8C7Y8J0_9TELE